MSLPIYKTDKNNGRFNKDQDKDADFSIICFSHLRWDFVYQRPQQLMSRFARSHPIYFVEEHVAGEGPARLDISERSGGVTVIVPTLPSSLASDEVEPTLENLLRRFLKKRNISSYIAWYYTPMMFTWSRHLPASLIVYDCMDELSLFRGAPVEMVKREKELLESTHLVFTGGRSLYEKKRTKHSKVHCFPSSIDYDHFVKGRRVGRDPEDQTGIPYPRLGYCGVIDERMDLDLIDNIASRNADWQVVMIGPVVKIEISTLPQRPNIHYLGLKSYRELPLYMAGWNVALLPFALNDSTRYIKSDKNARVPGCRKARSFYTAQRCIRALWSQWFATCGYGSPGILQSNRNDTGTISANTQRTNCSCRQTSQIDLMGSYL